MTEVALSNQAWDSVKGIYQSIVHHPFNQELKLGSLSKERFAYYIEQDSLYLKDFSRCHALIASRIHAEYRDSFLNFARLASQTEQEVVHQYFTKLYNFQRTNKKTPALQNYTSFLLSHCALEPIEVAVAAMLPCFWVYREVGLSIVTNTVSSNPYARWIETYASKEFSDLVDEMIQIFDALALAASSVIREAMLEAFYTSTCLEWHFWNDAYEFNSLDVPLSVSARNT